MKCTNMAKRVELSIQKKLLCEPSWIMNYYRLQPISNAKSQLERKRKLQASSQEIFTIILINILGGVLIGK